MRILTAVFASGEQFLESYWEPAHEEDRPEIHVRTRTTVQPREELILDVRLPGLPNRELLRGTIVRLTEDGAWVAIAREERDSLAFLAAHAAAPGPRPEMVARHHERFPLELACELLVAGSDEMLAVTTVDLSAGGAFVRAAVPPAVGSSVVLSLPSSSEGSLELSGQVVWRRQNGKRGGIGVTFAPSEDARRLRELLRRLSERGRIALSL